MTQLSLDFEGVRARQTDPTSSHEAALGVNNSHIRSMIVSTLNCSFPQGATSNEIARKIGKPRDHVSPHMSRLMILGYVVKSGFKTDSATGKKAISWKAIKQVDFVPSSQPAKCPYCGK